MLKSNTPSLLSILYQIKISITRCIFKSTISGLISPIWSFLSAERWTWPVKTFSNFLFRTMTYWPSSRTWSLNHSSKPKVLLPCFSPVQSILVGDWFVQSRVCVAKRDAMMDSKFDVALSSYFFIFHPPLYFWTIWPIYSMVDSRAVRIWWLIRFSYGNKRGKVVERVVACTDGPEEKQRRKTNGKKIVFANT